LQLFSFTESLQYLTVGKMIEILLLISLGIVLLGLCFGYVELNIIDSKNTAHNRKWHWYKGGFQGVLFVAIGYPIYNVSIDLLFFILMTLSLTVLLFNPIINKIRNRKNFFYIADAGIEGYFYKIPKIYYLINLLIFIVSIYKLKIFT